MYNKMSFNLGISYRTFRKSSFESYNRTKQSKTQHMYRMGSMYRAETKDGGKNLSYKFILHYVQRVGDTLHCDVFSKYKCTMLL